MKRFSRLALVFSKKFDDLESAVNLHVAYDAEAALGRIIDWYNHQRLHSSLGYLRPSDYYRGDPQSLHEVRRKKLTAARHRRREKNLELRQPTLPIEG